MPLFDYTALDAQGRRKSGPIEAPSREQALEKLQQEGMVPLGVEPIKEAKNVEDILAKFQDIKPDTMVYFSRQFATMIDSGMTPLQSLSVLEDAEENPKFKEILTKVIDKIEAGSTIWEAIQDHDPPFDKLYVAMVRSGEESGNLDGALSELASQLEKNARIRKAVKSATTYPKVVLAFAFLIVSGLLMTIVPTFAGIFEETVASTYDPDSGEPPPDASLPGLTQVVVTLSKVLYPDGDKDILWWLQVMGRFIGLVILVIVLRKVIRNILRKPGPREKWDAFKLRAPMKIGPLIQKITVARFSRTFASLLEAGVPANEAMSIVADTSGNVLVSNAVLKARDQLMAGSTISGPLAASDAFPTIVVRMIEVGEETGRLPQMLKKVADFFEEEVDLSIKALTSLIEPLMILVVGGAIGVIIIAIYLPMFALYDKIGTTAIMIPFFQYYNYMKSKYNIVKENWNLYKSLNSSS